MGVLSRKKKAVQWPLHCGHTAYWHLGRDTLPPETLWCRQCRIRSRTS